MQVLGHRIESPEGMFYPDTYKFARGTSDKKLLNWAYNTMQEHLSTEWAHRAGDLPYRSPYQALTAASLIERETAIDTERSKVAGVLVRRLKRRMRLQFDPTVIYGLGDNYTGQITKSDLRRDTPYNTYTRYGLPPTPIAMLLPQADQVWINYVNTWIALKTERGFFARLGKKWQLSN